MPLLPQMLLVGLLLEQDQLDQLVMQPVAKQLDMEPDSTGAPIVSIGNWFNSVNCICCLCLPPYNQSGAPAGNYRVKADHRLLEQQAMLKSHISEL